MKSLRKILFSLAYLSILSGQELCPPAFLEAYSYDGKVELYWAQTFSFGDVLFDECFSSCASAAEQMTVVNDTSICSDCSGGWFRYEDGTPADCGTGMYPCDDGGDDDFSAFAGYSGIDSTTGQFSPVDSRLIGTADLSGYTAAYIEFIEAYNYPFDATANNTLEISTDGGMSWDTVYVSIPDSVGDYYWFNIVDISQFAGQDIMFSFRYHCPLGYGEDWFVDDIRVHGGQEGQGGLCGTFFHYNIYQDGVQIGTTVYDETEYVVEGLDNGTEYCFSVAAAYGGGQSSISSEVCAIPMGPFQVNPTSINFDLLENGEYQESSFQIANYDSVDAEFLISSIELSNIDLAQILSLSTFEDGSLGDFENITNLNGVWIVGDSASNSSEFLPFPEPLDGSSNFALYNDDAAGEDPANAASPMLFSNSIENDDQPSLLVFDLYFPNPSGSCGDGGPYSEDFKVKLSTDDGVSWIVLDSTISTGWHWSSYMYNLEPYVLNSSSYRIGFEYSDCGGNWGYGVALDKVAIKSGDESTWLTVSPFRGNVSGYSGENDSLIVKVGAFGVRNDFQIQDELLIESGNNVAEVAVGVGIQVSVEESNLSPSKFALHQNYPNPFNPSTNIKFDIAQNSHVAIAIYNLAGQKVSTLFNRFLDSGSYTITWNGLDNNGYQLPSGMYFYEMRTPNYQSIKKLVLVK